MKSEFLISLFILLGIAAVGQSAGLIVNEYNAVGSDKYLDADPYTGSTKADSRLGRIVGNGGDWIELVVTEDHLDARNWQIRWWENDSNIQSNPAAIWASSIDKIGYTQGIITLKNVPFWSDLRKGTIITLSENKTLIAENTTVVVDGNKTNTNFAPNGDWWINLWTGDPNETYVHTETNKLGDHSGNFSIGNNDWEVNIYNGTSVVLGPIGEVIAGWGGGGINSRELGKLQTTPSATVGNGDYFDGSTSTLGMANVWHIDGTGQEVGQNLDTLRSWSWHPGDANLDNKVDVSDLGILAANYGTTGSNWRLGDFTGNGAVDVSDLGVLAANYGFNGNGAGGGGFPVPEPAGLVLLTALTGLAASRRN